MTRQSFAGALTRHLRQDTLSLPAPLELQGRKVAPKGAQLILAIPGESDAADPSIVRQAPFPKRDGLAGPKEFAPGTWGLGNRCGSEILLVLPSAISGSQGAQNSAHEPTSYRLLYQ
jgi:hypothetical protein